jgi:hypothetical protein
MKMDRNQILASIDEEISRLERVRALLSASNGHRLLTANGRVNGVQPGKKRVLSEDARNRIAQAQKRRWAKQRKEAAAAKKV